MSTSNTLLLEEVVKVLEEKLESQSENEYVEYRGPECCTRNRVYSHIYADDVDVKMMKVFMMSKISDLKEKYNELK
ncbi:MAG: hypothetical protein ACI4V7_12505 [Succinivibrionaceae bacterium]